MTHDVIVVLAALGVVGQALVALLAIIGLAALGGVGAPLRALRATLWGYELWGAFLVAAIATGGSLFFSEVAGFVPCELCWYQRICMYPLSLLTLFAAAHADHRVARYLLPIPVVGAGVSVYHLLIENAVISEPTACRIGGAGCAVKWVDEFGYVTIPTLALTAFLLLAGLLALAGAEEEVVATWKAMPSGKKSRQQRRVAAPPPVRTIKTPRRGASPRILGLAAVVALAIVAILIAVAATGGKSSSVGPLPATGSLQNALPGASRVNSLLRGIPQHGLTLGSPFAPVTLVEYIDLQCPYCQEFETHVMPQIVKRYVRTGKVKVEARVLAFIGPDSIRGRDAMIAAGKQGKAFDFAQLLYDNQQVENTGWLDDQMVAHAAASIPGLNPQKLLDARHTATVQQRAAEIVRQATADTVQATPTLFVGRSGGPARQVVLASPLDAPSLVRALAAAARS